MEPFSVNGRVDAEQLAALCDCQSEYPALDYKAAITSFERRTRSRAEFVKDCAAMMSLPTGGYLLYGVDAHGRPAGETLDPRTFDSATLQSLLAKHLEGDITINSQVHPRITGPTGTTGDIAVIYVGRRPDHLFPVVKADMTYVDDHGEERTHLRAGDVFVRDGTSSRRWSSRDLSHLLKPLIDSVRAEEQARVGDIVESILGRQRGLTLAQSGLGTITWRLSADDFNVGVAELARAHDEAALRVLRLQMRVDGQTLAARSVADGAQSDSFTDLLELLDRAAAMTATAIVHGDDDLLAGATRVLHDIYCGIGVDGHPTDGQLTPRIWLEIASRILACIALAVRLEEWHLIAPLTLRPVGDRYRHRSWLRHADLWATRTNQSKDLGDGAVISGLLIAHARQCVAHNAALRPDRAIDQVPPIGQPPADLDPVLDSLCQGDLLWCVVAASGGRGLREQYPSFAALFEHRTRPILDALMADDVLADVLVPGSSALQVREVAHAIWAQAEREGHFW